MFTGFICLQVLQKLQVLQEVQCLSCSENNLYQPWKFIPTWQTLRPPKQLGDP